jgi:hypothetical protein
MHWGQSLCTSFVKRMKQKGSTIASVNLFLAALLVLAGAGWSFVQKGYHSYYEREAKSFFEKIEKGETAYRNRHNLYLPFGVDKSTEKLKELKINPKEAEYYNYSVEVLDRTTYRIIAQLKPEIIKKWYLHNPDSKLQLVYEKKDGRRGRIVK